MGVPNRVRVVAVALLALALLLAACGREGGSSSAPAGGGEMSVSGGEVAVGEPAPSFTMMADDGQTLSSESLAGQIVIVNFWATWCAPCRLEMPELESAANRHAADGLTVIGVEVRGSGGREESATFLRETGVTFPTVHDAEGIIEKGLLKLPAYPTTIFINRVGEVHYVQIGPVTRELLDTLIEDMNVE